MVKKIFLLLFLTILLFGFVSSEGICTGETFKTDCSKFSELDCNSIPVCYWASESCFNYDCSNFNYDEFMCESQTDYCSYDSVSGICFDKDRSCGGFDKSECLNTNGCEWELVSWTQWFDMDNVNGNGDYEPLSKIRNKYPTEICDSPTLIQCETLGGVDWNETGQNLTCDLNSGLFCSNDDNSGFCHDYRVRFYCGELSYECLDSDSGIDYFDFGSVCIDGECFNDYCIDEDVLVERYCDGGDFKTLNKECISGCEKGECVYDEEDLEESDGSVSYCSNSDNCILYFDDEIDADFYGKYFDISISHIKSSYVKLFVEGDETGKLFEGDVLFLGEGVYLKVEDIYYDLEEDDGRVFFRLDDSFEIQEGEKVFSGEEGVGIKVYSEPSGNSRNLFNYVLVFVGISLIMFFILVSRR